MAQFIIESKRRFLETDFNNFRALYSPIIGPTATSLFLSLSQLCKENDYKTDYKPMTVLKNFTHANDKELTLARRKLEAIGLIKTYSKKDEEVFLFLIVPPLSIEKFIENKILWNKLISVIGEVEAERIAFQNKMPQFNKDEFIELTAKYHDLFSLSESIISKTSEIEVPEFALKDRQAALEKLSPALFIRLISKSNPSPALLTTIKTFKNLGVSDHSINLIINYSNIVNGKIVAKYIETIAFDLFSSNISTPKQIKQELDKALSQKNKQEEKTNKEEPETKNEGGDLSLDEMFSDLFS